MSRMNVTLEGEVITRRFFHVLDVLKQKRRIRGLQSFTKAYGLNYWNMSTIKNSPHCHALKPEWLAFLVQDYDVSAEYLLTGVGSIFKSDVSVPAPEDVDTGIETP